LEEQRGDEFASAGDADLGEDVTVVLLVVYGEAPSFDDLLLRGANEPRLA
jgi:hypothetical protein